MARFDVYLNPDVTERKLVPFLLDMQNTFVDIDSRVVIPLYAVTRFGVRAGSLNPELLVQGKRVVMNTSALAAVPLSALRQPVANLVADRNAIQEALDTLFGGY